VAASTPDSDGAARSAKRSGFGAAAASSDSGAEAQRRSEAREAALAAKPLLARILQTVLAIAYPFLLLIGAIKLVASPWFLWLEYNRPGFPADAYGFSAAERLTYGSYGVDYLNNAAGPEYLGSLVDASGNPLFLNTEVEHMADVKAVIAVTFAAGLILLVVAALIALYLSKRYAGGIRRGLFAGAVSTIALMAVLAVLGTLNWRAFFTGFHSLFFAEGTWTFSLDDTLIRLYPTQFWVDSAISVAGLVLLVSAVTLILTWPTARRRERSRLRQEARDFGLTH
jgi:integral membrane protein (TIGR01906 family)